MDTYDAIVIGGSVAGAPTAMLLARKGLKVLLVDKDTFPRDVNSTHFIWPRGMSYLNRWGLADHIVKSAPSFKNMDVHIEGIKLRGQVPLKDLKNRFMALHGNDDDVVDYYCGPRRYFLDEYLLNSAKEAGVDVRENTRFTDIIVDNNDSEKRRIIGIEATTSSGMKLRVKAKLVIGADGKQSAFAKKLGLIYKDYRELSTFAYYGYFSGIDKDELSIHKKGQFGTAIYPTLDKTQMALVYGPTRLWRQFKVDAEKNFFNIFEYCAPEIMPLLRGGERVENFKAYGHMPAFQRESTGPGWVLIGDAASFKDQVTAMGITHSFRDAELLSSYIASSMSGEYELDEAIDKFQASRQLDYEAYFDLVCSVAEMNNYTVEDLKYFYGIKDKPSEINKFIAQFGDTLPLLGQNNEDVVGSEFFPESIRNFSPTENPEEIFEKSHHASAAAAVIS